ncbi:hypothetical protein COE58_22770 [Bacillus cereus]|nr:hypothetical protein COL13_14730 [Bacillus cereus]PGZ58529.1 hypothetical protein COE58_22770 [Bacillus cereus]
MLVLARTGLVSVFIMGSTVMACKLKRFRKLIGLYAETSDLEPRMYSHTSFSSKLMQSLLCQPRGQVRPLFLVPFPSDVWKKRKGSQPLNKRFM